MNEYVIKKLREGRISAKLKQSEVAERIGIKGNTLSNYENGVSEPDIDTFCALCDIYKLNPSDILNEAYGLTVQGSNFCIKPSEIDHIKKYRDLDDHGKDMVNTVLEKEYTRFIAEQENRNIIPLKTKDTSHLEVNAARPRTDLESDEVTTEMRQHDEDIMDDTNF